jgi:ribosomal protein S2
MGWNLSAYELKGAGVTRGAPLERWNQHMLRFARRTQDDWAEIDPDLLAQAITEVLDIARAVTSTGGNPVVVGDEALLRSLWDYSAVPVIDSSRARRGLLADLPPSEQRLARLIQWSSQMNIDVSTYIDAARSDLRRERKSVSRNNSGELVEQPDILLIINIPIPPVLLAESLDAGIPVIATTGPETDPGSYLRVLPGDFSDGHIRNDLIEGLGQYVVEGRTQFNETLAEYGTVGFLLPDDIRTVHGPAGDRWLRERIATPQASVDSDEVIASWSNS